jgi:hypothetical protein
VSTQRAAAAHDAVEHSQRRRVLNVLVVGTDDWAIEQTAASLQDAGHEPQRCHDPGAPAFPCNALRPGRRCPLDTGVDLVVTSRARPLSAPALSEMGVTCALHAGLPLVVTGIADRRPFRDLAARNVSEQGNVTTAAEDVVRQRTTVIRLEEGPE